MRFKFKTDVEHTIQFKINKIYNTYFQFNSCFFVEIKYVNNFRKLLCGTCLGKLIFLSNCFDLIFYPNSFDYKILVMLLHIN